MHHRDVDTIALRERAERAHQLAGYPGEHRIRVNGRVVSHNRLCPRLERYFFDHLRAALLTPETFDFDGYGGRMSAAEWLLGHSVRLRIRKWEGVELLSPEGVVLDSFTTMEAIPCPS